jgi:hypothetical protein
MHQAGYSDTTRRELILGNLTKIILENKSMRYVIGGDMNAASLGGRDGYSQNPATVQLRKAADEALTSFSQRIGATLISPNVPTWRRGDGTQSATWDHVILVNFPDKTIRVTAEALGDIQHDHLCLKLGLDSTVFGDRAPEGLLNTSTGPRLEVIIVFHGEYKRAVTDTLQLSHCRTARTTASASHRVEMQSPHFREGEVRGTQLARVDEHCHRSTCVVSTR